MGRRTKKQKEKARSHFKEFILSEAKKVNIEANVKRQIEKQGKTASIEKGVTKKADILGKEDYLATVKKDIIRSLIITSLILGIELVLYLTWH